MYVDISDRLPLRVYMCDHIYSNLYVFNIYIYITCKRYSHIVYMYTLTYTHIPLLAVIRIYPIPVTDARTCVHKNTYTHAYIDPHTS